MTVQSLLDSEEKEADHAYWYDPKLTDFKEFLSTSEAWMNNDDDNGGEDNGDEKADSEPGLSTSQVCGASHTSMGSRVGRVSAACLEAEVDRAALSMKVQTL